MREAKSERFSPKSGPLKTRAQVDREKREDGTLIVLASFWVALGFVLLAWKDDWLLGLTAFVLAHLVSIWAEIRKAVRPRPETAEMRSVQDARREERRERSQRRTRCLEAMSVGARVGDKELHKLARDEFEAIDAEQEVADAELTRSVRAL